MNVVCQIFNRDVLDWFACKIKIHFPPDKHDFNNSVSLTGFESQATSAVIVGHSSNDLQCLLSVDLEHQYLHFRLCAY